MNTVSVVDFDVVSVFEAAFNEARQHCWIESQKQSRDLGEQALRDWYHRFWWRFLRYRHLEHLLGERPWEEFDRDTFGSLQQFLLERGQFAHDIVDFYRDGWENLDIINWAIRHEISIDEVYDCLNLINMNDARIDPRFN